MNSAPRRYATVFRRSVSPPPRCQPSQALGRSRSATRHSVSLLKPLHLPLFHGRARHVALLRCPAAQANQPARHCAGVRCMQLTHAVSFVAVRLTNVLAFAACGSPMDLAQGADRNRSTCEMTASASARCHLRSGHDPACGGSANAHELLLWMVQ